MPFNLTPDSIIFSLFLIANLALGLFSSRGITTIKEYAVGDRKFTTAVIVSTIVATWIGGHDFMNSLSEAHKNGLNYIWVLVFADLTCISFVGYFFSARMGEFLGKLSIAEAMGDLFGRHVRIITAICGFIGIAGVIAIQFQVAGKLTHYAFGIEEKYGIIIAAIIVTSYSALGGIKAVTFTDVIQFITFSITIPLIAYFLLHNTETTSYVAESLSNNPLYDYTIVFDFTRPEPMQALFLFLFLAIPDFSPTIFQRISIAKDTLQVRQSFIVAGLICGFVQAMLCCIGVILFTTHPELESSDVVPYLVAQSAVIVGFKGLILAGVMSMVMSTVDSCINCSSVLMVHDFCKSLNIKLFKNELASTRIVAVLIGVIAVLISMKEGSILELLTFAFSFYMPVVTVPFVMAILGFRSSGKSVLLGMAGGAIAVMCGHYFELKVNPIPPAMFVNLIVLFASHYLLKQPGGWVGIKDRRPLEELARRRELARVKFWKDMREFTIGKLLQRNCPSGDGLIAITGFFLMISVFSSVHHLNDNLYNFHHDFFDIVYPMTLASSAVLIGYPLWLQPWKDSNAFPYIWNFIMFFVLIVFSFLMVLMSDFSEIQLMAFMVNLLVISALIRWKWAFVNIAVGCSLAWFINKHYIAVYNLPIDHSSTQFSTIYLLLLVSSALVLFLKPKEGRYVLAEDKIEHLSDRITFQNEEISKLVDLKHEFLRNLEHETRTPITGITSLGQVLSDNYDKFSEKERRSIIDDIARSGERLNSLASNLIDLSKLSTLKYKFDMTLVDLSALAKERIEECQRLYITAKNDKTKFVLVIQDEVMAVCDPYYIGKTIDNIIINAMQYCKNGEIVITVEADGARALFSVSDDGIGIPDTELPDIFGAFTVSSRTRTPAGGRGLGLALCKKVIDLHKGTIKAENNPSKKGVKFTFKIDRAV